MAKHITSFTQFNPSSRHVSYRLGLIDPSTLAPMTVDPLDAPCFKLLVPGPADLPTSLLIDPEFRLGAIVGYYAADLEAELEALSVFSPLSVTNWIWKDFYWNITHDYSRAWLVGYLLGTLTSLAEVNRALALVGIAHLSFLLALVPPVAGYQLYRALNDARCLHSNALGAYRFAVRAYKEAGCDLSHAQRFALTGYAHVNTRYADGSSFLAAPDADESEVA